jgi:mono/diheme cytochrome c family protein
MISYPNVPARTVPAGAMLQPMTQGLAIVLLLLAATEISAQPRALSVTEQQGEELAERMCAQCHALGSSVDSPHPDAPPFGMLNRRIDLDTFTDRLRAGLVSGHPDMPTVRFSREDARALLLYLRAISLP